METHALDAAPRAANGEIAMSENPPPSKREILLRKRHYLESKPHLTDLDLSKICQINRKLGVLP